ncbi:MAG: flagellar type III secretion system pore protein FliP [Alphaproteobacteria bacterium]
MKIVFSKKFILALLVFGITFLISNFALAQSVTVNLGDETGTATGRIIQFLLLTTILSIAPSILVMTTSFTRIAIVLSIVRNAIGANSAPPNNIIISLSLFLTAFIMTPVFEESWKTGLKPLIDEKVEVMEGLELAVKPLHHFMAMNTRDKDIELFMNLSKSEKVEKVEDTPLSVMIPAFMISEIRRAFEISFLIYIPFIVIDMVVASILMSMGMMMLPPVMLSMPFKIIFFVLIDGWYMLCGSLVQSFVVN